MIGKCSDLHVHVPASGARAGPITIDSLVLIDVLHATAAHACVCLHDGKPSPCAALGRLSTQVMLQTKYPKVTWSAREAFNAITLDIWTGPIVEALTDRQIVRFRSVSKSFCSTLSDDDLWLGKLTLLATQYPQLADLAKGEQETVYAWHARCYAAVADGRALARRHLKQERPFLLMYGTVAGTTFTAHAPLRLPIEKGFIAELCALKACACSKDPAYDALLLFDGVPHTAHHGFKLAWGKVKGYRANVNDLRDLPNILSERYAYVSQQTQPSSPPAAGRRALDVLQRQLGHRSVALAAADARVEKLEAEVLRLQGKWELRGEARVPTCVECFLDVRTVLNV